MLVEKLLTYHRILWKTNICYHVNINPPLSPIWSQMERLLPSSSISIKSTLILCFSLCLGLPSDFLMLRFPTKSLYALALFYVTWPEIYLKNIYKIIYLSSIMRYLFSTTFVKYFEIFLATYIADCSDRKYARRKIMFSNSLTQTWLRKLNIHILIIKHFC